MLIKRYNEFINESRSEVLHSDLDAFELIEEMVPWYILGMHNKEIYRGVNSNEDYIIVEPSESIRKPVGEVSGGEKIPTYYNNILLESKRWYKYSDIPRDKSIFASNNYDAADFYSREGGSTYLVIPFEKDTEFIMAQQGDMYSSFGYMEDRFGLAMPYLLMELREIFKLKKSDYQNLSELRSDIESVSDKLINKNINGDKITPITSLIDFVNDVSSSRKKKARLSREEIDKYGGVTGWLEMLFDPDLNQFMRVKYNRDIKFDIDDMYVEGKTNHAHELWTNKKCLLIRSDLLD